MMHSLPHPYELTTIPTATVAADKGSRAHIMCFVVLPNQ